MILEIFIYSSLIASILIIWFNTEAFQEYAQLFKVDKFFKVRAFKRKMKEHPLLTYHDYLNMYYSSFFVRLITCPYCLGAWVAGITALLTLGLVFFGVYYVLSLLIYSLTVKHIEK